MRPRTNILSDWLHNLPVGWLVVVFFGCAHLSAGVIYVVIVEFPTSLWMRARAISGSILSPIGTLFAAFVVFTAAQVWTDTTKGPLLLIEKRAHSEMS